METFPDIKSTWACVFENQANKILRGINIKNRYLKIYLRKF